MTRKKAKCPYCGHNKSVPHNNLRVCEKCWYWVGFLHAK